MSMSKLLSRLLYDFLNVLKVLKVVVLPITEIDIIKIITNWVIPKSIAVFKSALITIDW